MNTQSPADGLNAHFKNDVCEDLTQQPPGVAEPSVRFTLSPDDPCRAGYRVISAGEFEQMKGILVGAPEEPSPFNECPACV